jgi:AraC-like DNA-binding protein
MVSNLLNLILLNLGHAEHNADWNYADISSPFARIYYVTQGTAKLSLKTGDVMLKPNHLYIIPPFVMHSDSCAGHFSLFYLHFYESDLNTPSLFEMYRLPTEVKASELDLLLMQRLMEINQNRELKNYDPHLYDNRDNLLDNIAQYKHKPLSSIIESNGIVQQFISRFMQTAQPKFQNIDHRIYNAIEFIANNVENNISVKQLTDISCLSKDHFIRLFKKETGVSPLSYIHQKKIEKAQSLLVLTNYSVKDIAFKLSFENVSYFNRIFKKNTATTPNEYRMYNTGKSKAVAGAGSALHQQ